MKPILEIHNIYKKFKINHEQLPYLNIRESISNILKIKTTSEDFWALQDVSFNVNTGDTIGIIGKNGAGKSTLLKILSKITPPTSGRIISRGRIASLLEVGTGFHPELTGRENIFMNGSILGMKRNEIFKNFEAIVDFSGVEKFIDTPLKHYSSGMQLRLAFAVAAFLENEILIIDEVLAVGDADFQKKCMGKMSDVSQSGRTIIFVSHNLTALESLCSKSILLQKGSLSSIGETKKIIQKYLESSYTGTKNYNSNSINSIQKGNEFIEILAASVENASTLKQDDLLDVTTNINFRLKLINKSKSELISVGYDLLNLRGDIIFGTGNKFNCKLNSETELICKIPGDLLNDDVYQVYLYIHTDSMSVLFYDKELIIFEVKDSQRDTNYLGKINGFVRPKLEWRQKY